MADEKIKTVNITPTWQRLLPALVEVAANGETLEGRREAMTELMRLAKIVDDMSSKLAEDPAAVWEELKQQTRARIDEIDKNTVANHYNPELAPQWWLNMMEVRLLIG